MLSRTSALAVVWHANPYALKRQLAFHEEWQRSAQLNLKIKAYFERPIVPGVRKLTGPTGKATSVLTAKAHIKPLRALEFSGYELNYA